jgi:hypothetical protein
MEFTVFKIFMNWRASRLNARASIFLLWEKLENRVEGIIPDAN